MSTASPNHSLVSVIIPAYNRQTYIKDAIESVLAQSHRPIEIIVVDDGSTDHTAEIAKAFQGDVRCFLRKTGGPAAARNDGLKLARGELISFLDSDDLWPPNSLTSQLQCLNTHPHAQHAMGKASFFMEPGTIPPGGFRKKLLDGPQITRLIPAMVARKSVFDIVGPFDDRLRTAEDVDWFCRANDLNITMTQNPSVVLNVRIHRSNMSLLSTHNTQNLMRALRESVLRKKIQSHGDSRRNENG